VNPRDSLGTWVLVWTLTAALILIVQMHKRSPGAGLLLAYLATLALNHYAAATIYLLPGYRNFEPDIVAVGFQQATFAVIGLAVGSLILAPIMGVSGKASGVARRIALFDIRVPQMFVFLGIFFLLALRPFVGRIPTASAFVSQGWGLLLVGVGLGAWYAWHTRRPMSFAGWVATTVCLPLITIVTQGFIGFGTVAALAILAFIANFTRPGWKGVALALVFVYLGLSLYVTYMRDRLEIRDVVWTDSPVMDRLERVQRTFTTFEWFQASDPDHLSRIDDRLNQNVLVGQSVVYLETGLVEFAHGSTLINGLIAIVPRAIWPTKPVVAGSGDVVADYTGLTFAEGTSVGVGNVMEAYISFGTPGVVIAFLVLGVVVTFIDNRAGRNLQAGDWRTFVRWYLPGLSLLQVGGSFTELTSSVAVAVAVSYLVALIPIDAPRVARREPELAPTRT
jgi:hypothetical protein